LSKNGNIKNKIPTYYLWGEGALIGFIIAFMFIIGITSGIINGRTENIVNAILSSPEDTIKLVLLIGGSICFWNGIMKIAERSGILKFLAKVLKPLLKPLFPDASEKAIAAIIMNISANLLGLGNAATPMGIIAMKELIKTAKDKTSASGSMITFVVLNTVGFQIVPTTVAALRSAAGSTDPFSITIPMIVVSFISLLIALIPTLILNKKRGRK
jgi:spore maturation protein A